jgi:hypothetical protein
MWGRGRNKIVALGRNRIVISGRIICGGNVGFVAGSNLYELVLYELFVWTICMNYLYLNYLYLNYQLTYARLVLLCLV